MTESTLLYLDLLGVKARWRTGGEQDASAAFRRLEAYVGLGIQMLPQERIRSVKGGVQSDAAALIFADPLDALVVGKAIFQAVFQASSSRGDRRDWIRGVIVPFGSAALWEPGGQVPGAPDLESLQPTPPLLRAIALEQSGFKGMRLLVDRNVMPARLRRRQRIWLPAELKPEAFVLLRQLHDLGYPERAAGFDDYLWWIPHHMRWWDQQMRRIRDRIRWAAADPEELLQAVSTLVAFESCAALLDGAVERGCRPSAGSLRVTDVQHQRLTTLYEG